MNALIEEFTPPGIARDERSNIAWLEAMPAPWQVVAEQPAATQATGSHRGMVPVIGSAYRALCSANQRARYVRMMSAPARLIAVRCSSATASWSIQPFSAAALIMEYSPLT